MLRKSLVFFLPLTLFLAASTPFAEEQHVSNSQVTAEIQDKLYHAKVFKHGKVNVAFNDGVATLTGSVDSLGAKMDAERAARKVDDVVEIVDHIRVNTEDITPQQIIERARKEIVTYPFYTIFDNIVLEAQAGNKLVVSGQVTEPYKKSDIGNLLARIAGVAELENNLEVLPTSNYDDQLRIAIARAIYNDPYFVQYATVAVPSIHIIVKNGNVTLDGVVNSEVDRAKAETDARFAATFFSLTNNLRIEGKEKRPS